MTPQQKAALDALKAWYRALHEDTTMGALHHSRQVTDAELLEAQQRTAERMREMQARTQDLIDSGG